MEIISDAKEIQEKKLREEKLLKMLEEFQEEVSLDVLLFCLRCVRLVFDLMSRCQRFDIA
jgi:hypothetical protein